MSLLDFMVQEKDERPFSVRKIVAHFGVNRPLTNDKQARRPLSAPLASSSPLIIIRHNYVSSRVTKDHNQGSNL